MSAMFEELDRQSTPMGEISLRRRFEPSLQVDIYEAMLGEEHLMSSLFTVAEIALATLGLAALEGDELDVVVGGLGLGYTAQAVLDDSRVRSLHVVEALGEVVGWHDAGLLPLSASLTKDPRCHLDRGDFFSIVATGAPFGDGAPAKSHAVLVDIDHTPRHLLHPSHAPFYEVAGLRRLADRLHPGGVFALWSDARPDPAYVDVVDRAIGRCQAHVVPFPNPHTGGTAHNTVYVAVRA